VVPCSYGLGVVCVTLGLEVFKAAVEHLTSTSVLDPVEVAARRAVVAAVRGRDDAT